MVDALRSLWSFVSSLAFITFLLFLATVFVGFAAIYIGDQVQRRQQAAVEADLRTTGMNLGRVYLDQVGLLYWGLDEALRHKAELQPYVHLNVLAIPRDDQIAMLHAPVPKGREVQIDVASLLGHLHVAYDPIVRHLAHYHPKKGQRLHPPLTPRDVARILGALPYLYTVQRDLETVCHCSLPEPRRNMRARTGTAASG